MELYPNDIGACPSNNLTNFVTFRVRGKSNSAARIAS